MVEAFVSVSDKSSNNSTTEEAPLKDAEVLIKNKSVLLQAEKEPDSKTFVSVSDKSSNISTTEEAPLKGAEVLMKNKSVLLQAEKEPDSKPETGTRAGPLLDISGTRSFSCRYCTCKFKTQHALGGHQNSHRYERDYAKHMFERNYAKRMIGIRNGSSPCRYTSYLDSSTYRAPYPTYFSRNSDFDRVHFSGRPITEFNGFGYGPWPRRNLCGIRMENRGAGVLSRFQPGYTNRIRGSSPVAFSSNTATGPTPGILQGTAPTLQSNGASRMTMDGTSQAGWLSSNITTGSARQPVDIGRAAPVSSNNIATARVGGHGVWEGFKILQDEQESGLDLTLRL